MSFTDRKTPWQAGDLLFLIEENEFGAYSPAQTSSSQSWGSMAVMQPALQ